jgi:3-oxo-5-alpha-steroid 4-dehydrogenase 1
MVSMVASQGSRSLLDFNGHPVYHDEILHNLRRPSIVFRYLPFLRPAAIASSSSKRTKTGTDQDRANKTYFIPAGGLFPWVTFPNYLSEWWVHPRTIKERGSSSSLTPSSRFGRFEWACYAYMTSPIPYKSHPPVSGLIVLSKQYPSFARPIISRLLSLPIPFPGNTLLTPPWMFLIAEITAMVPRAINGERWYAEKFGVEWKETGRKGGRWICLPGLL